MKLSFRLFKTFSILLVLSIVIGIASVAGIYYYLEPSLPSTEHVRDIKLQVPLRIYSADEQLIAEYGEKRRYPVSYDEIPETIVRAFLAAEDDRFFEHIGVDYQGLIRAAVKLVLTGERKQGGSTITMQVARNIYLSRKKTFTRKLSEIFLALKIEEELSKEEILSLYLNKIYLGNRAYGIAAAAQIYYGKTMDQLSLAEAAMLAGLPKAPSRYNPIVNPERAKIRRTYVLGRMRDLNYISEESYQNALPQPITAKVYLAESDIKAPYVAEMVRDKMIEKYGEKAYSEGYRVVTTIKGDLQTAANAAVMTAVQDYDKRHGWRGVESRVELPSPLLAEKLNELMADYSLIGNAYPAVVLDVQDKQIIVYSSVTEKEETISWDGIKWARAYVTEDRMRAEPKKASDVVALGDIIRIVEEKNKDGQSFWRIAQLPRVEGGLVSVNPKDGAYLALTGGYSYAKSKFNRVIQAKRQPGSGFKAYIYSAALDNGFTAASIINDAPVVFNDSSLESHWRPQNYSGKFFGPTRLRYALTKSRNLVSIRLLRQMGVEKALEHVEKFGFDIDDLPKNLSLSLGSGGVTMSQMARGYSVLANGGFLVTPYLIDKISQGDEIVYQAAPLTACNQCKNDELEEGASKLAPRVISEENRYLMYSMMQDVITAGTGTRALVLKRRDIAGKTGTTNDQKDAWFNGYNQSIVANVWVGFDEPKPLGRREFGGSAALPAWIDFMKVALKDSKDKPPYPPRSLVRVRIDKKTGLKARPGQADTLFEYFREENVPEQGATDDDSSDGQVTLPLEEALF